MNSISGTLIVLGDNITTDKIVPDYNNNSDEKKLSGIVLQGVDEKFPQMLNGAGIIIAGENFGIGNHLEPAIKGLKMVGIKCIIATSFGRDFYRKAMNYGLALINLNLTNDVSTGDDIEVSVTKGRVIHKDQEYKFYSFPDYVCTIIEMGGIINAVKKKLGKHA
jgi:3-isopropylmalate/(R)-2-methylmalate dehydratase small subunit